MLYGIALTYGATGSTSFTGVAQAIAKTNGHAPTLLLVAMGLMVAFNVMTWIAVYASRLGFTGV